MSVYLAIPHLGRSEVAARLATGGQRWIVLVTQPGQISSEADAMKTQLEPILATGVARANITTPTEVVAVVEANRAQPIIITGFDSFRPEEWRTLDLWRSRLLRSGQAIIVLGEDRISIFAENAPNLWSWVGGSTWFLVDDTELAATEVEQRLQELRARYQLTDDEVRERGRAGTLPPGPDMAEWLVLLGQGALVARDGK